MLDDLINEEGNTVALNNLLNKEKKWLCKNCQSTQKGDDNILCYECQTFKPLTLSKNLLHNPLNATE